MKASWTMWLPFLFINVALGSKKMCPGGSFTCPDSATCCQLPNQSYGCCPIQNAVCCDDHIHCCPPNHKCSVGMCIQMDNVTIESNSINFENVLCPDGQVCPDDTTCCKSNYAELYGCCPFKNAVCCNDGVHCCPSGSSCDIAEGKCNGDIFITMMYDSRKLPSKMKHVSLAPLKKSENLSSVICPDKIFQCPDGHTCCQLPDGHWGCCPFLDAVCCSDHLHCCPENMKCSESSEYCSASDYNVTAKRHITSVKIVEDVVCPNKLHCQNGMTCCPIGGREFACCQYHNATCCSDHLHCCPSGYECDMKHKKCVERVNSVLIDKNHLNLDFQNYI